MGVGIPTQITGQCRVKAWLVRNYLLLRSFGPYWIILMVCVCILTAAVIMLYNAIKGYWALQDNIYLPW